MLPVQRDAGTVGEASLTECRALTWHRAARLFAVRALAYTVAASVFIARASSAQTASRRGTVAVTHVTVIDVEQGRRLPDRTVIVEGARITRVGPSAREPVLWDMHVHTVSREIDLPLNLAYGVTGVRDMGGTSDDTLSATESWGIRWDSLRAWREDVRSGRVPGPRIVAAGVALDGPKPVWRATRSVSTPAEARQVVDSLAREGVDFIKVYGALPRDIFLAVADEVARHRLTFAGHLSTFVSLEDAASAGQRSIEHANAFQRYQYDSTLWSELTAREARPPFPAAERAAYMRRIHATFDTASLDAVARILVRHSTWIDPTLVQLRGFYLPPDTTADGRMRLRYVPPAVHREWVARIGSRSVAEESMAMRRTSYAHFKTVMRILHRDGVRTLAGSDAWNPNVIPGSSLHDELALFVDIGMSPLQALQAATLNPARFLGTTDSLGSIAAGKLADLVLLDADPLADISNTTHIRAVLADGRLFDRAALDALLAGAKRAAAISDVGRSPLPVREKTSTALVGGSRSCSGSTIRHECTHSRRTPMPSRTSSFDVGTTTRCRVSLRSASPMSAGRSPS